MSPWPVRETFDVWVVGKRLSLLLLAVTIYYVAVGLITQTLDIGPFEHSDMAGLINTVLLGLLMSFRNRVAYQRWWDARGLWGQLVNDSRNLAAKCAAFVPADAVSQSRVADILINFADALRHHLRSEPQRLQDLPGFEHDEANPPHIPLYLAQQLFATIAEWKRAGHIDQSTLWILDTHARGLLDVCGACEKILTTPLSPSYIGLLRLGLALNVFAAPWMLVPESGLWSCPAFMLACVFLFGVEVIDSIVEEPFGRERDELDLDRYCRTIRDGVLASLRPTKS